MIIDRKARNSQNILANKRSHSSQKLHPKPQHLLSKPKLKKSSLQKNQQSFSTMFTNTYHKNSSPKLNKTCIVKKNEDKQLNSQVEKVINILKKQIDKINISEKEGLKNWNQTIQELKNKVNNDKIKLMITLLQKGYNNQNIQGQNKKNDDRKLKTEKKKQKLSLNIGKIDKQNIIDYHDEFMGKIEQFSQSWREMLKLEKKSM